MNIVFAGTPEFAAVALRALMEAGHRISVVLTQPDRPAGRGMELQASAVKALALQHGWTVQQPTQLKMLAAPLQAALAAADVMVVAAYGMLLPPAVLDLPRYGCINIHASLLPRWRGAAPIQRALLAGDSVTGVTIMQMEAGLDSGPMLLVRRSMISAQDTSGSLFTRLAELGAQACCEVLQSPEHLHKLQQSATPQDPSLVVHAAKIRKDEAWVDWRLSAGTIERQLRAFLPHSGLTLAAPIRLREERLKLWQAAVADTSTNAAPGTLVTWNEADIAVACGQHSVLRLQVLQRAGGKRLPSSLLVQQVQQAVQAGKLGVVSAGLRLE